MGSGWGNQSVDEITAPNTVPFLPGNNVTGFGSQIPDELAAIGITNAIVFYASDWNPAATTRKVKFRFIAATANGLIIGYGYALNPSVSQTAFVVTSQVFTISPFTDGNSTKFLNNTSDEVFEFTEQEFNTAGTFQRWPQLLMSAPGGGIAGGETISQWVATNTDEQLIFQSGSSLARIAHTRGDNFMYTPEYISGERAWTALPLVGGWTGDATRVPLVRRMPDGTVQMKGFITKVANPVNGESWISGLAAQYRPLHTWTFLTATPGRAANTGQVVEIRSNGTGVIFDMAALAGSISLDSVRYAVI